VGAPAPEVLSLCRNKGKTFERQKLRKNKQKTQPKSDRAPHDPAFTRNRNYATLSAMTQPVLPGALHRVVTRRQSLSRPEAHEVMAEILRGGATDAQIAGLLIALSMKGETVEEIVGFAQAIREAAPAWPAPDGLGVVDTCGTGGDISGTLNISTAAALVAAGAGVPVAKHGNRSVSSKCGSADRGRDRVSLRSSSALGHEVCADGAARSEGANGIQSPGPADESCAGNGTSSRRLLG
jgi:Glycosyl transferase family, a/b domain/Glycosyl transferase family, helical bundle domain